MLSWTPASNEDHSSPAGGSQNEAMPVGCLRKRLALDHGLETFSSNAQDGTSAPALNVMYILGSSLVGSHVLYHGAKSLPLPVAGSRQGLYP